MKDINIFMSLRQNSFGEWTIHFIAEWILIGKTKISTFKFDHGNMLNSLALAKP